MKANRFGALLLAASMTLSMTACNGLDLTPKNPNEDPSNAPSESPSDSGNGSEAQTEGYLGDTMSTSWFDFTLEEAYLCDTYESYTPAEGNQMLVVSMSIQNTSRFSVPMYQNDFPVLWDSDDEDSGYAEVISAISDDQFQDEYNLGINKSVSGLLVYEVPKDVVDFTVAFMEVFDDDQVGDTFFVDFTPDPLT